MDFVYCAALVECLLIIQASENFAYYQGFRKHLTIIIEDYLLAYMWYVTFDIKKRRVLLEMTCFNRKLYLIILI